MKRILPVLLLCCSALALQAQTECGGKETYPAHYCDCQYNQAKINSISQLNYLNFNDSLWFQGSSTIFTNAGMTAYLFSESDVQVDVYQRCTAKSTLFSFTVPKNQTRDMDAQAIKDRMIAEGVDPSSQMAMRMVFYPVEEGAQCELYCYPYNTGPNSTAKDPLPVLVGMTYVSSHAYDVYELKAENIPASCALYTQWSEPSNLPCQLTITRGSATGEEVAVHDFLNASTYFRFDPNFLAEVRASGESLFMHYRHDASAAGRIITREAPVTTHVTDTTLCQGKGVEAYGVNYTAPGLVAYNREWVGTSLKVCEYKYNLILTEPEVQYDTLQVHVSELPMLYRGQYLIPSAGACDFDCTIHHDGECDERYLLHVVREYDDYVTACYGEAYEWHGTTYTQNGTYTKILQNSYGCDSIVTLHLTMQTEIPVSEEDATICGGEGYEWNGEMYYETGDYEVRLQDANGCDSIAILHLTVLPADDVVTNQEICHGDSWLWDETGEEYGITIVETAISSKNDRGNASTNANAATPFTINKDAITIDVSKGSVAANGAYYQINSRNTITIASSQGNIRSIELTCTASGTSTYGPGNINVDNGSYSFSDKIGAWVGDAKEVVFTTSKYVRVSQIIVTYEDYSQEEGSVVIRKPNTHGCEVNYILNWKLVDCSVPDTALFSTTACDSYIWHDTEYTSSGTYYYYTTTSSGRERVEILTLTLNKSVNYEQTISACNSYTWTDGKVYTESGTYTQNLQTVNGCDSIVTLHLTINKSIATEETITACDSHTWNGETYTESGDYTYTTTAANGCDSVVTLHLTINKTQYAEETAAACDSYTWNGETYTESGDYTYTTTATNGCDSIVTLHLTINKSIATEETITACDSHTWNGETYTESGDYTYITTAANGCDSVVTLHLTINKSISTEETITACDSHTWNGETYTESGDYTYTTTATNGCDSIVTLHLTINKSISTEETITACDSHTWNGQTYTESGDYTYTTTATNGCDSVVTLHLTLNKTQYAEATAIACDSYVWNGQTYTESGDYTYTTTATNGCDSVVTLHLTINKTISTEETITACDSYTWTDSKVYTESGSYTQHLKTVNACDSIVTLHLTINKSSVASDEYATICYGDSYTWNNQIYNNSGDYTLRLENVCGCDSVVTLHLTVLPPSVSDTLNIVIGSNELPYLWRGKEYTSTGTYYDIVQYVHHACDSAVHVLDLTVLFIDNVDYADATICESSLPYTWYDQQLTTSGKYSYVEQYVGTDIDSIQHILNLTVIPTAYVTEYATACDRYVWNGQTYTESGDYTYNTTATNGCDSIVTLHLTINKTQYADEIVTACDSYVWNGETYTASGDYTYTTTDANGCDSVVTLHLTINKSIATEETITACDSYTWNGNTYTASGDYTYTTTSKNGCDSVVTLHLTINKSISTEETITACDSYTWNGNTYTASGDYTYTTTATNGCDSVVTLHLTINKTQYADETVVTCDSYTWNGETYTASGDYTYTTTVTNGCDSIITLHLTINKSISTEETITACDSHTWNGETYTASGDYTYTTTATNGCDSVVTLHLTINKSISTEETFTACDSYTWNGETYTESGDYTYTTTATNGCDSIVTLHLTVNKSIATEETITVCDSHTWNGETYTESGDYTYTTTATNGCDSVVTLHLTINKTQYAEETITACNSYAWNGETYTESGDYTYNTTATNGCDSVVTLHLTINKSIATEETITACDSYTWTDSKVYTESGSYTQHLKTVNACDSIVTLHLTVNKSSVASDEYATICYGERYTWNGKDYQSSGDYTITLSNAAGCDSVVTLHLVVLPEAVADTLSAVVGADDLPYLWHGKEYVATGLYVDTEQYATIDCDSAIHYLDLTVLSAGILDEQSLTLCETELPYLWYDQQLTTSGKYSYVEQYAGTDIDSIQHILNLTVIPTAYVTEYATACDSYVWNGQTYTESGDYTYTTTATNGCDSVVTLHVTINKTQYAEETAVACDSYTWNGETYTESGDYTYTTTATNGCDSIVTLHLTINKSIATEETITAYDSYTWNGETYTESGDYTYTTTATNGCDSVVTLHLTINKSIATEETITACDSHTWNGETYTESGDYTYTTTAANGCDSIVTLHLTINKTQYAEETVTACDSYTWNGETYTESGDYTYTTTATNGCDSVVTLHLTINKSIATEEAITACDSYIWTDGKDYTESGTYTQHLKTVNGCDSIVTLHLTINKSSVASDEYATICYDDSYTWNNQIYNNSGDYTLRLENVYGCDSVVTLHLTVLPPSVSDTLNIVIGSNELPYLWRGKEYTSTGTYYDIVQYVHHACDSAVHVLDLTVLFTDNVDYADATICESSLPYTWYDQQLTTSGKYSYVEQYVGTDIDSIQHILNLTVIPTAYVTEYATACDSYTWTDGKEYTESGTYTQSLQTVNGCDSIVTLHLTVNKSSVASDEYATICYGEHYTWNGKDYQSSGDYTITLSNAAGCDSVVTLHLVVLPEAVADTLSAVVVADDLPYLWRGKEYVATGLYVDTEQYATIDCDSAIHYLDLTVLSAGILDEQSLTLCETELPYLWYDQSLTTAGKYSYTEQYAGTDIDSVQHILHLIVNPIQYTEETITACDSYEWNGETYTESGDYIYTTIATTGCDSIVTLHLTILPTPRITKRAYVCYGDSYEWYGEWYDATGEYSTTLASTEGCDTIATLYLTVMPETVEDSEEVIVCASDLPYYWYGRKLTKVGVYTHAEPFAKVGCDSVIHTLTLDTYKMTLPNAVTLPTARAGEPINILVPTEEIQAHIDAQTWYAPNPIISWYVMQNAVWTEVSDEPVGEDVQDLILKYAVDTDCGKVESKNMKISVIPTAVDDITASDECTVRKVIMDDKVFIIRGNKMYSLMGVEVR